MKKVARLILMLVVVAMMILIGGATCFATEKFEMPRPYWNEYHPGLVSWKPVENATSYTVCIKYADDDGTVKTFYCTTVDTSEFDACWCIESCFGKDLYAEVKVDDNNSMGIYASEWGRTVYFVNAKFYSEKFVDNWTAWKNAYKRIHGIDLGNRTIAVRYAPDIQPGTRTLKPVSTSSNEGWKLEGNRWYFYKDGKILKNRWIETSGYWYYVDEVGAMKFETWIEENGEKYWIDPSGIMATGWRHLGKNWFYFYPDGKMAKDCWVSSGSTIYYIKPDGKMHFGEIEYGGVTYYVNPDTGCYGR